MAKTLRYYLGAANASAAVEVSDDHAIVADDETSVLRLYDLRVSGPPVATFDFTAQLPFGSAELDLEAASRHGDILYWQGSLSTSSGGDEAPSRSTLFATRLVGSGADATLAYLGSYTRLRAELLSWDDANGSPLGLAASAAPGVHGHEKDALNIEGMEFVTPGDSAAYLGFRAPLQPTSKRHLALIIPVTNYAQLPTSGNPGEKPATFGDPFFLDLGGLGIRDLKANAEGEFLILAGSAGHANDHFALYEWDGNPAHAARLTDTVLPQFPSKKNPGSWETIVGVPNYLASGDPVRLIQDDGDVAWTPGGLTSKTGEPAALQRDAGLDVDFEPR